MSEKYYVTTPIYYVNGVPHIGHAYTTIAADVLARWNKVLGKDVYFTVGTDEHGQKVAEAAAKRDLTPKAFVDSLVPVFKDAWKLLNIDHNRFIRTTDEDHKAQVQHFTKIVAENGDIYKGEYEGWYCVPCETFWTELQLVDGLCPTCSRAVKKLKEASYFFRLSKYQDKLLKLYEDQPDFISPDYRKQEIINRVQAGLKDLSISRAHIKWGIPFGTDESHSTYVWFDALTNYLTAIGYPVDNETFNRYWPADVHIVGKEILWFHTVIWPAMLMSAGLPLPKKVFGQGFLTVDKQKMSKSVGNVVDPIGMAEKYGADPVRFFLLKSIPYGMDGDFSERDLVERRNSELADDLGNYVMRVLTLLHKYCDGTIPTIDSAHLTGIDKELIEAANIKETVLDHLEKLEFHLALETIWTFVRSCNKYFQEAKPWAVQDQQRQKTILYLGLESIRLIATYVSPFIPESAEKIFNLIGTNKKELAFTYTTKGTVKQPTAIFTKEAFKAHPFSRVLLKVAKIVEVNDHPNADKLYVLRLDVGKEERQVVAGMKAFYSKDELIGRKVVFVANLKHGKFRGVESQGMLVAADHNSAPVLLNPRAAEPGEIVSLKGVLHSPCVIKADEFLKLGLRSKDKKACYEGIPLQTPAGHLAVGVPDDAVIR